MATETPVLEPGSEVETQSEAARPWNVILHDDPHTTIEFVAWLLTSVFGKPPEEAVNLTLEVHRTGAAIVATASFERAELYVEQVHSLARARGFPLVATMEKA